jgi:predicted nuclease of predicted toxin-antitoxin system
VTQRLGGQTPDAEIAARVAVEGCVLVTKDDDFALRHPPEDYQLLWLRCGNIANRALRDWLLERWTLALVRLEAGERLIEVRLATHGERDTEVCVPFSELEGADAGGIVPPAFRALPPN